MMSKSIGKSKLLSDKKGGLPDVIFGGAYLVKVAATIIICVFVWISFQTLMTTVIAGHSSEPIILSVMSTLTTAYYSMDYLFPLIIIGLLLVSTIFAYKTGANIVLGFISFIIWVVAVILSAVFVNVYLAISDEFPTVYAAFPIMDVIMSNLHLFTLGWLAIITLVMFRKNNQEDTAMEARFYGQ